MKKLVLSLIMLLATSANTANAESPVISALTSSLKVFDVQHGNLKGVNGGSVQVNFEEDKISLTLFEKANCPEGAMCILGFYQYKTIEVDLTEVNHSDCGDVYAGVKTSTIPMSSLHEKTLVEEIKIVDYSSALCEIYFENPVLVQYSSYIPNELSMPTIITESNFYGSSFVEFN